MVKTLSKVLLLTHEYPPFRGGIGTYCEQLADAAAKLGHKVTVWAPSFGEKQGSGGAGAPAPGKPEIVRFKGGVFKHWQFPRVLFITLKAALTNRGGVIMAADWPFVAACGLLCRVFPFRYRIMLHGSEILFFRTSRLLNLITLGNPFYGAEVICANSNFTKNLLLTTYPKIPESKVRVTYLGMNTFWLTDKPKSPDTALLKRLGIPADKQIILTVGRIHPRKGQKQTMAALALLPAKLRQSVAYVIVGQAVGEAQTYFAEIAELASGSAIPAILTGAISNEDVRSLYQSATVYCMPSVTKGTKVEGFGLVFLEAAGSSLPSISVSDAAVPEVVKNNETGLLTTTDNPAELAKALEKLLTDKPLTQKLGTAARKWAGNFTWQRCAEETFRK